jgi:ABC-type antimicrobial peptide transport system permease subunit
VKFQSAPRAPIFAEGLAKKIQPLGGEMVSWPSLFPDIVEMLYLSQFSTIMVASLLGILVGIGILNTIFMSIHERMGEFGVMKSLGARPFGAAKLIVAEAAVLACASVPIGMVLGTGVNLVLSHYGIDFSGMEFAGTGLTEPIRSRLSFVSQYVLIPLSVFVFTVLIAIIPARSVARMTPIEGLRKWGR